jgi:hypothetical protein
MVAKKLGETQLALVSGLYLGTGGFFDTDVQHNEDLIS